MTMRLTKGVQREIVEHAQAQAPIEACGFLAARNGIAEQSIQLTNVDHSPEHFSLDPAEQFSAVRNIRRNGMQLRAVYHSHPASPARPSQEDVRLAFDAELSYIIVSLASSTPVIKSFSIQDAIVTEEKIEIVESGEDKSHVL
jgi:[CysO sulfur-carrier protein]-S-L-cysteine hydrolase